MQLVAQGAQDIYLTGNPQITFFKVVYRRHTNFSMESIEQTFSGSETTSPVCTISRNGDLVHKMYLVGKENEFGVGIQTAELEIGGQRIDRQSIEWMNTWNELSTPESKAIGLKSMQGHIGTAGATGTGVKQVHIPLLFWFCRNPGLALPLIALQYHEVKVKFSLASSNDYTLFCDYIYLDTDERRRFAQVSHEYLIEQVQEQDMVTNGSNKLNFNHPVKELIWRSTNDAATTVGLKLNGHERFSTRQDEYFYLQQPFDYHTAVPAQNLPSAAASITEYASILNKVQTGTAAGDVGTPGQVMVGFTDTAVTHGGTVGGSVAAFATSIHSTATANQIFYTFTNADFDIQPAAGDKLLVCYGGVGSDVGDGNATQKFVKVISAISGSNDAITSATGFTHNEATDLALVLDTILINPAAYNNAVAETIVWNINSITKVNNGCRTSKDTAKIGVYSFALKPEEHQPSGTCNFSRIDNAELTFGGASGMGTGTIYAVNYNVLRIMSGMGGLAYSN